MIRHETRCLCVLRYHPDVIATRLSNHPPRLTRCISPIISQVWREFRALLSILSGKFDRGNTLSVPCASRSLSSTHFSNELTFLRQIKHFDDVVLDANRSAPSNEQRSPRAVPTFLGRAIFRAAVAATSEAAYVWDEGGKR